MARLAAWPARPPAAAILAVAAGFILSSCDRGGSPDPKPTTAPVAPKIAPAASPLPSAALQTAPSPPRRRP